MRGIEWSAFTAAVVVWILVGVVMLARPFAEEESGPDLRKYWLIARKHSLPILALFTVPLGPYTFRALTQTQLYTA